MSKPCWLEHLRCAAMGGVVWLCLNCTAVNAALLELEEVADGLDRVTNIVAAPGSGARLYVAEQAGRVRIVEAGGLSATAFLDITDRVRSVGFEQGLTGFALHPNFPTDPRVFVHYIDADSASVIASFNLSNGDPLHAAPRSERRLLTLAQPHPTHNCNQLAFGPDGYLYIGCGDGGPPFTPVHDPQNLGTLYGKILRVDIDANAPGLPYAIPPDNPFVNVVGARAEIWALGLRNPFRFSFDSANGDLWLSDVGQSTWEEVNFVAQPGNAGYNFGWNRMEGTHCYPADQRCDTTGLVLPAIEYDHSQGRCSVIGGLRVRDSTRLSLDGAYLYADFCSGEIFGARPTAAGWLSLRYADSNRLLTTFGVGADGALYVGTYDAGDAQVFRLDLIDEVFADDFD